MARNKPNHSGRNPDPVGRFVRLGHDLLQSPAYRVLRPIARALLVELVMLDTDKNNGKIFMSETDAAARLGVSDKKAVRRAFVELVEAGFIRMTKDSHWAVKAGQGRARCWRLTWRFDHANRKAATNDWREYQPADAATSKRVETGRRALKRYTKNQNAGEENTPTPWPNLGYGPLPGEENTPANSKKPANALLCNGEENTPHIAVTMGVGGERANALAIGMQSLPPDRAIALVFRQLNETPSQFDGILPDIWDWLERVAPLISDDCQPQADNLRARLEELTPF